MVLEHLVDRARFRRKKHHIPAISLWGFHRCFFSGKVLSPSLSPDMQHCSHNNETRKALLAQLFGDTVLDLERGALPYFPPNLSEKSLANRLTPLWTHDRPASAPGSRQLEALSGLFGEDPEAALDGVARNIRWLTDRYPDPAQLNKLAGEILLQLCPERSSGIALAPLTRRLAILAVMALLDENDFKQEAPWLWLAGQETPYIPERPSIPSGVFSPGESLYAPATEQIDPALLPELVLEGTHYAFHPARGSPLRQLLERCPENRRFLLCGQASPAGDTTVSGAGKTSSLRYLFQDRIPDGWLPVYLPLAQVYAAGELADPRNLHAYISLHYQLDLDQYRPGLLLLLDGLDELVHPAGLQRLCRDLEKLTRREDVTLVLASKQPPDRLPSFETLMDWSQMWECFRPCLVQPMSDRQRGRRQRSDPQLLDMLDTPFLVSLYRSAFQAPFTPAARRRLARWNAEELFSSPPQNGARLFYASLIAQLVRWFESNTGQDRQSEADAFFLLHTLPAIAFQRVLNDVCEGRSHPAAGVDIDRGYVERMIALSLEGTWDGLELFPGYRTAASLEQARRILPQIADYDHFLSGQAVNLLQTHHTYDLRTRQQRTQFTFANHSLQDYLASLHIANIFLLAQADRLPDRDELLPFYSCTLEFLPLEFIRSAADMLALFFPLPGEGGSLQQLLFFKLHGNHAAEDGMPSYRFCDFQNLLSQWLAGSIGGCLCEKMPPLFDLESDNASSSHSWYRMASQLDNWFSSRQLSYSASRYYHLSAIAVHSALCRLARSRYDLSTAVQEASYVCARQRWHPDIPSSDGQHMYALTIRAKADLICLHDGRYHAMAWLSDQEPFRLLPGSVIDRTLRRAGPLTQPFWFPDGYIPPDHLAEGSDLLLRLDPAFFPWLSHRLAENFCIDEDSPVDFSPQLVEAALLPVRDVMDSLRRMAQGEDMANDPVFPSPAPETIDLAPIFIGMLERGFLRYERYREKAFFASRDLQFLCIQSLRAKALSIYSACAPGASGAALNHLGFHLENQGDAAENAPSLSFFRDFPHRHLDIPELEYDQPAVDAFRVYRRVYDVRRGLQPYSSRKLAELLLTRRVRLDEAGQPHPCTPEVPFNRTELDFLEQATCRAATARRVVAGYWRARYLHERALFLGADTPEGAQLLEKARTALARDQATERQLHKSPTLYSALLMVEDMALNYAARPAGFAEQLQTLSHLLQTETQLWHNSSGERTYPREKLLLIQDCHRRMLRFGKLCAPELLQACYTFIPPEDTL